MYIFRTAIYKEIYQTILCVIGLFLIMISFYIFTDRLDSSVILGSMAGSAASILNYALNVFTVQISAKYDPRKAALIILMSKIFRTFLMGLIAFIILYFPIFHTTSGIVSMFFSNFRYLVIKKIKSL